MHALPCHWQAHCHTNARPLTSYVYMLTHSFQLHAHTLHAFLFRRPRPPPMARTFFVNHTRVYTLAASVIHSCMHTPITPKHAFCWHTHLPSPTTPTHAEPVQKPSIEKMDVLFFYYYYSVRESCERTVASFSTFSNQQPSATLQCGAATRISDTCGCSRTIMLCHTH